MQRGYDIQKPNSQNQDRECPSADYSCIIAADSLLLKIVPVLECLLTCCQLGD